MKKLVTVVMSASIILEADTDEQARSLVENDPEVRAMAGQQLAQNNMEITDIQDYDE